MSNPDTTDKSNNWPASFAAVGQLFYLALLIAIVCLLAYYATKLIANARFAKVKGGRANIKVIESVGVGLQSSIQLIKVGEKYILIAVAKERVSFLTEIDAEQIDLFENDETQIIIPFEKYLRKFVRKDEDSEK